MEYTSTAFSHPLRIIFKRLYQPAQEIKADGGGWPYFPQRISYHGVTKPVFEEYLYRPVLKWLLLISAKMRNLQAGSVQLYLVYILLALILLMFFAL